MKTIKLLLAMLSLVMMLGMTGCESNDNKEIDIYACGESNPEWLVQRINSIINKTTNYRPVGVYSITLDSTEYIAIVDSTNSSLADGLLFFLCPGEQIDYSTSVYEELYELYVKKEYKLLWSN